MDLPYPDHRSSEHPPRKYTAHLVKMLEERNLRNRTGNERQPESTAPIQMKPDGVPAGRENQHRSRRRSGDSTEHSQESVTVDDVSSGLRSRAYSTKQ
jgi:hypothetical protein